MPVVGTGPQAVEEPGAGGGDIPAEAFEPVVGGRSGDGLPT